MFIASYYYFDFVGGGGGQIQYLPPLLPTLSSQYQSSWPSSIVAVHSIAP